jgi:ABC-2 type transport system permease protein
MPAQPSNARRGLDRRHRRRPGRRPGPVQGGKQSVIQVIVDTVDPIRANYAGFLAGNLASAVNQEIIRQAVGQGQGAAIAAGDPNARKIPAEVVAAPTRGRGRQCRPLSARGRLLLRAGRPRADPASTSRSPLVALALVRERTSGIMEVFRVAPVNAWEIIAGKVIAYVLIGGSIAAITVGPVVGGLHIPMLGDPTAIAAAIALLLLASLGIGLVIAVVSDSERQAVQLSLLLLLASVFFSGFVIAISEFSEPVRAAAYLLPVTSAIGLLQDLMLRGVAAEAWRFAILGAIAVVTLFVLLARAAPGDGPCLSRAGDDRAGRARPIKPRRAPPAAAPRSTSTPTNATCASRSSSSSGTSRPASSP